MNDMSDPASSAQADWADEDRARADHYALLARLFYAAPDADLLAGLAAIGEDIGQGEGPLAGAWAALAEAARDRDAASIGDEYARLFVSVSKPEVMLFGSFYQTGFLMEEPLADLRADLVELGLGRRSGVSDSEDHLAALAEVMRHLIVTGPDAAGLARQQAFFARHLQPWYAQLTDALARAPGADFYSRVGALARAFFDIEAEAFSMT